MRLRPLRPWDTGFCWRLAWDPMVRRVSFSQSGPTAAGHARWMLTWLLRRDRAAWIVLDGHRPLGLLRARIEEGAEVVVSIALVPAFRGRGIGLRALTAVTGIAALRWDLPIAAYIKDGNEPSIALFAAAGFKETFHTRRPAAVRMQWRGGPREHSEEQDSWSGQSE